MINFDNSPPGNGKYAASGDVFEEEGAIENFGEDVDEQEEESPQPTSWLKVARLAYESSTSYFDNNHRKRIEDSIRAFNNQHPADSKYNSSSYSKRSQIYRPKTRTIIRRNEAAAAVAFFSNTDTVSVSAVNQGNPAEVVSAEVMKQLLEYRLSKSVPWFQILLGGLQDAQTTGLCIAHAYWDYAPAKSDKPCIDLIPVENFRFDPAASWTDPVNTSPYLIEMIPMWVVDVKEKMMQKDREGNPIWKQVPEDLIKQATKERQDTTVIVRNKGKTNPYDDDERPLDDYSIVWIQRHIHRRGGIDWEFHTLSDIALLTEPKPLITRVWHGMRPYVIGKCILETHKAVPTSIPEMGKGLQDEANEVANQRLDNIKLALNKRWIVKRGKNVDLNSLIRNVPGGITMADDPEDVREVNWPDVTQSSYAEQDRINADMDDLLGNFSPASVQTNRQMNETVRGMAMLQQTAAPQVEYLLRTYVETFVEPLLRHLVKLEQKYETDQVLLAIAAQKSKISQKYGVDQVTDELLNQDLTLTVNVGMGATDPITKTQKFLSVMTAYQQLSMNPPPGANIQEIAKELFGLAGYQDGTRFFNNQDPQVAMLGQKLQQATQMIQQLQQALQGKGQELAAKAQIEREKNQTKVAVEQIKQGSSPAKEKQMALDHSLKLTKIDADYNAKMKQIGADVAVKLATSKHTGIPGQHIPVRIP